MTAVTTNRDRILAEKSLAHELGIWGDLATTVELFWSIAASSFLAAVLVFGDFQKLRCLQPYVRIGGPGVVRRLLSWDAKMWCPKLFQKACSGRYPDRRCT